MTQVTNATREEQEGWVVLTGQLEEGSRVVVNFHLGLRRLNISKEEKGGCPGLGAR